MDQVPDRSVIETLTERSVSRRVIPWDLIEPWIYLLALGVAELVSDLWQPLLGLWLHALLVGALLARAARASRWPDNVFYPAISILPLVRIVGVAVSPHFVTGIWYYVAVEAALFGAAVTGIRMSRLPAAVFGLCRPRSLPLSGLVVLSGIAAGWAEQHLIQPPSLAGEAHPVQLVLPALLLIVFTGFGEEILFRGLIQSAASARLGVATGIIYTALGYSFLHIVWGSAVNVVFVLLVGLAWGWLRQRNQSVLDLGLAHGLANVMLFFILPAISYTIS